MSKNIKCYQRFRRKSVKSLVYTVRSETTNIKSLSLHLYIQHYIKLLIKIWP